MDPESVSPASTANSQGVDLYHALGGMNTCRELAAAFYVHVEHDPVLRPLYPPTLKGCPIKTLSAFLIQFFGGPCEYAQRRWSLSLREAHLRFAIGQKEREAWLNNMFQAIDEVNIKEPTRSALRWFFVQSSAFFINQPSEATNESPSLLACPIEHQNDPETSRIHQDIAQRWHAQRMLEEMIAAVRQENADAVLALIENPVVQASFTRDRAAFLSFLAIMSDSSQRALLDYVRQTLVNTPELARERYTYDRTLLHEVAGQGSLSIVELLLHLGADPNARDQTGHTPLYFVGNASHGANGADIVRVLIQNGANVNAQERLKHCTALHMAARRGNIPVAEALLDYGAQREARDKLGDTPLHRAVKCGKTEMVTFLLSRGADVHAKGKRGLTPWQVARGANMKQLLSSSHE
ncbi:MAG TPA: ankyrin repeat domain-containing protein [Ktedonobacteraceae bacterium]|jgi:hemoglobin